MCGGGSVPDYKARQVNETPRPQEVLQRGAEKRNAHVSPPTDQNDKRIGAFAL